MDYTPLDNPIWNSLASGHRHLAVTNGQAARYPAEVSPLAGIAHADPGALADLREMLSTGQTVGMIRAEPFEAPAGWQVLIARPLDQMVCERPVPPVTAALVELGDADAPEMLALAKATEPGPFEAGTIRMGRYRGLRSDDGRLMAMAGERMRPDGFTEVSAVCTWPEFRGRGLATTLVSAVSAMVQADGRTPFLHVLGENSSAKAVYEKLGFRVRREMHLRVMKAV